MKPRVLVLAGLEPLGRAGLLADVETIRKLGGAPVGIATALTAQSSERFLCERVNVSVIREQIRAGRDAGRFTAIKLGMIPDRECLSAIVQELADDRAHWVIDPIVSTSNGEILSTLNRDDFVALGDIRRVVTPNVPELKWLTGVEDESSAANTLLRARFEAVVVKGGHRGATVDDAVYSAEGLTWIRGRKLPRRNKRGTGCRYASALATALAHGASLTDAARMAKRVVQRYLAAD